MLCMRGIWAKDEGIAICNCKSMKTKNFSKPRVIALESALKWLSELKFLVAIQGNPLKVLRGVLLLKKKVHHRTMHG